MAANDRRSGIERRRMPRAKVNLAIEWESHVGTKRGTMSDVSRDGCFILSSGNVSGGERVYLNIPQTDGTQVRLAAEVSESIFDIGFAAKFVGLTEPQRVYLERFVEMNLEKP